MKRARAAAVIGRALAVNAVVVATLVGCVGPTTTLIVPECADRLEIEGQHRRDGGRRVLVDHTFDLPLSRTRISSERIRDGQKTTREIDVVNSRPDLGHVLVGAGLLGIGGLLGAVAVRDVVVDGQSPLSAQPFYSGLIGGMLGTAGAAVLLTGWHPPADTTIPADCEEAPPGAPPMPPSTVPEPESSLEPPPPVSSPPQGDDQSPR